MTLIIHPNQINVTRRAFFWGFAVIAVVAIGAYWLLRPGKAEFRIGALLPQTGSGALYGQFALEGTQLAFDEINASGGIDGQGLDLVFEDSRSDAKVGVTSFESLHQRDVPTVLSEFSPVVVSCAPSAN